ncbi:MAG: MBL fold metallo-hydrolase [Chlamydiales bacterium]|nr:MBL fold metallo-hydrolase [Chlamydiales bacterium]
MSGFFPLASGSKGNCLFLRSKQTRILIDAGIGVRRVQAELAKLGESLDTIDALLITHEHGDHVRSLEAIAKRGDIPVFANGDTAKAICEMMDQPPRFKIFSTGESFEYGDLKIHPFSIQHDTLDPVAFTIEFNQIKLGICADLGFVSSLVKNHLQGCHYLYIESNHDPEMVYASPRPNVYKQRVLGRQGHLSNEACAELLKEIAHPELRRVYLAHLSSECNRPELAYEIAKNALESVNCACELFIAHQDRASEALILEESSHQMQDAPVY